ncbi:hypothetical protein M8J77_002217 [Diaphorina citri]|nr:hypothetical protein M8J77_002217 [Diaphorina citri]
MAIASVKNILVNSRMTSQESRMQLFQSIVCATLLYGAEIWGSRYEDMIEVVQSQFLKSVFCLPRCTPHYMVRLEFGVVKLAYHVLKQMLRWWLKLLSMPEERYPRKCYNQLVVVDQLSRKDCSMEQMTGIREQQEHLARLHFELGAQQELFAPLSDEGLRQGTENMHSLMSKLEKLSISIEKLHSFSNSIQD